MHAAAQWTAFAALHSGGTIVLHDDRAPFDARTLLETVARERVNLMSIVGDAFARRLIEELRRKRYDLASLQRLATGGAFTSASCKEALLELIPHVTIVDGYGASETGGMAYGATDEWGYYAQQDKVHMHDLHATILHLLGLEHTKLTYRYAGRDFRLTDVYGHVVKDILV